MNDRPSITCPQCGMVSYNPNDISNRYCGNCHLFHDQMEAHMTAEKWLYRPMPPELESLAETAAEAFRSQLAAVRDGVLAGGHTTNDVFSVQAHVLAWGIDWLVDELQARAKEVDWEAEALPIEAYIGILLNDAMGRFWMKRRG